MEIAMQVQSKDLSEEQLSALTRELSQTITQETDISTHLPVGDTVPGAKGDPVTIGTLALTFITSGAAVALFEVLKAYFSRDASLKIAFKKPDGSEVSVSSQNMEPDHIQETIVQLKKILEG